MAQSVVTDNIGKTQTTSYYGYDAFGRRTLVQDEGFATMRTLYDGQSFDIIRENEVFGGGDFTTNYSSGIEFATGEATGGRYRYIEDGSTGGRYRNVDGYIIEKTRFTGTKATLYANGESVGVNRFSSTGDSSGRAYFGTDILGSVRSATTDGASIEDRYEYDAFGTPYKGDFSTGLDNGYTGKPYDQTTGLYNYGFRDYSPQTARFTTVDPIRDGNNWFSYVVNDPVNYVDLWGLEASNAEATDKPFGYKDLDTAHGINLLPSEGHENRNRNANNIPDKEGVFVVVGHGSRYGMTDSNEESVKLEDLAEVIKNHPSYSPGDTVQLVSCNTGATIGNGIPNAAQRLANELGPGAKVIAPDGYTQIKPNGDLQIDREKDESQPGEWIEFTGDKGD